jgi:hypothetical protein
MSPSNIPRTLALTALRRLPLVADRERSGIVVVLMAALLCATPALAQYQSPSTSAAAGGSCSGSNFIFPDANGHILQCVSSVWTAVSDAVWSVSGSNIYYNGGNVGIGTASPADNLTATNASGAATLGVISAGNSAGSGNVRFDLTNGDSNRYDLQYSGSGNTLLKLQYNGASGDVFNSNGSLMVGSPAGAANMLDVNGRSSLR